MADNIRAFIAIPMPDPVLDAIRGVQAGIRRHGFNIRWVRPEAIHLTLKFLGNITSTQVSGAFSAMAETAADGKPFTLFAKGVGVFPGLKRARVLWVGLGGDSLRLIGFQRALDDRLAALGFQKENRSYRGHLTIGRIKTPVDGRRLGDAMGAYGDFESEPFTVRRIHLIQSDLRPAGAVYTCLKRVQITGGKNP